MGFKILEWLITFTAIWIQLTFSQQVENVVPDNIQPNEDNETLVDIFEKSNETLEENNKQLNDNNIVSKSETKKTQIADTEVIENNGQDNTGDTKELTDINTNKPKENLEEYHIDSGKSANNPVLEREISLNETEPEDSEKIKSLDGPGSFKKDEETNKLVEETTNDGIEPNLNTKVTGNHDENKELELENGIQYKSENTENTMEKYEHDNKDEVVLTETDEKRIQTSDQEKIETIELKVEEIAKENIPEAQEITDNNRDDKQESEKNTEEIKAFESPESDKIEASNVREDSVSLEVDSIQSFEEWKKKQIISREVAAATENAVMPQRTIRTKKTQVNYASQDCGAKILTHNSEAKHVAAVLDENKDMYMLNPCSADIFFVVELCEPIQIRQLQLANFELFSSSPRIFNLLISERYPAREWRLVGTFEARNERILQTFVPNREELMFAKYVKFEMKSHFGNEHFCPLTLIRLLGLSMVEEYEENEDKQAEEKLDNKVNEPEQVEMAEVESTNEEGSMTKVFKIVKSAVDNLLGNSDENNADNGTLTSDEAIDPNWESPVTLVTNKSEVEGSHLRSPIITLIETGVVTTPIHPPLHPLIFLDKFMKTDFQFKLCWMLEFVYRVSIISCMVRSNETSAHGAFPTTNYNVKNITEVPTLPGSTIKEDDIENSEPNFVIVDQKTKENTKEKNENGGKIVEDEIKNDDVENSENTIIRKDSSEKNVLEKSVDESQPEEKDTKSNGEIKNEKVVPEIINTVVEEDKKVFEEFVKPEKCEGPKDGEENQNIESEDNFGEGESEKAQNPKETVKTNDADSENLSHKVDIPDNIETNEEPEKENEIKEENVEPEVKETNTEDSVAEKAATEKAVEEVATAIPPLKVDESKSVDQKVVQNEDQVVINPGTNQKESVLMRLSNRIRALEQNMSLSSDYLEDLSQRYKRQMDETQRAFNCTQTKLFESSKLTQENDLKQSEAIAQAQSDREKLKLVLENTQESMDHLNKEMIARHLVLMAVEGVVLIAICVLCFGVRQIRLVKRIEKNELKLQEVIEMHKNALMNLQQKQLTAKIKHNIDHIKTVKIQDENPPKIFKRSRSKVSMLELNDPPSPPSTPYIRRRCLSKTSPIHSRKINNHHVGKVRRNSLKTNFSVAIQNSQNSPLGKWNSDEKLSNKNNRVKKNGVKNEKKLTPIENKVGFANGLNDIGTFNGTDFNKVLNGCGNNFNDTPWQNPTAIICSTLSGKAR